MNKDFTTQDDAMAAQMNMSPAERERAEKISALLDGELDDAALVSALARDAAAAQRFTRYHSIGDLLRSPELAPTSRDETFMTRMRLSLAAEPVVIAPAAQAELGNKLPRPAATIAPVAVASGGRSGAAASAMPLRTIAVVGGLAVAAVMAMSWSLFAPTRAPAVEISRAKPAAEAVKVAEQTAVEAAPAKVQTPPASLVVVQTANGAVIRDARLDQYFAAHSGIRAGAGLGSGASMAAPAAFVRGASIDSAVHE